MNKVLLFGGTGEGRALAEWMVARDIPHTGCVIFSNTSGANPPIRSRFPMTFFCLNCNCS